MIYVVYLTSYNKSHQLNIITFKILCSFLFLEREREASSIHLLLAVAAAYRIIDFESESMSSSCDCLKIELQGKQGATRWRTMTGDDDMSCAIYCHIGAIYTRRLIFDIPSFFLIYCVVLEASLPLLPPPLY